MKTYDVNNIFKFLGTVDTIEDFSFVSTEPNEKSHLAFLDSLIPYFIDDSEEKKTVLGIDIYKYSKYEYNKQKLIPVIFRHLINTTVNDCFRSESCFSDYYNKDSIAKEMIDTGDGGFFVFQNPIDTILFTIYFTANLHSYNSYHTYPNLRKYIGPLTIRYAITYDKLYQIDTNFYGPAIINNARIMSHDKLNRLLIDGNTYEWFLLNTNGIENLPVINAQHISVLKPLAGLTADNIKSLCFKGLNSNPVIKNVFCQKLEKINVKEDNFDVYNLIIQICLCMYDDESADKSTTFITTTGNMNCNGI